MFLSLLAVATSLTHARLAEPAPKVAPPAPESNASVPVVQLSLAVQQQLSQLNLTVVAGERVANDTEAEMRKCAMDLGEARASLKAAVEAVQDSKTKIDSERGQLHDAVGKHSKQKVEVDKIWKKIQAQDKEAQKLQGIITAFNTRMQASKSEVVKSREALRCRAYEIEKAKKIQDAKEKDIQVTQQALDRLRHWPDIDQWRLAQYEASLVKKKKELKADRILLTQKEKAFEAELARIRDQATAWENDRRLLEQVSGHLEALEDVLEEKKEDLEDSATGLEDLRQLMDQEQKDLKGAQKDYEKNQVKLGDSVKTLMHAQDEQIGTHEDYIKDLKGVIKGKTLKIEEQNGNLRTLTGKVHATNHELDKTKILAREYISKRDNIIQKQEDVIAQQGTVIDAAEKEISQKDSYVNHLNQIVSKNMGTIDGMERAVAAHEQVVENMKEAYSNTKSKLDKCLVRDWSKEFKKQHKKLAAKVEDSIEEQHDELEGNIKYHVSNEVHSGVEHLDNRMVEESDHVVNEVDKNQMAHHGATISATGAQAAETVDQVNSHMDQHAVATHATVEQNSQGLAGYVEHLSSQVEDLKKMVIPIKISVEKDPIIEQMKRLEGNLNDLQNQITTTANPIQQELKALSDQVAGVQSAMQSTSMTTTTATTTINPDQVTAHLSGLKKALEVAGATQHMQALKDALQFHVQQAAAPVQQTATVPNAFGQPAAAQVPIQQTGAVPNAVILHGQPAAAQAPLQQAVAVPPGAVVAAAQPEPEDSVTQHLMALKNSFRQPASAQNAEVPHVQVAPAPQVSPGEKFHEQLKALANALPPPQGR
jgi:chromosome segregation ATPase